MFVTPEQVIRMGNPPIRIEIITSASGVEFEACFSRKLEISVDNIQISLISKEDLFVNKKAAGRLKDLNDLEHLS